MLIRLQKYLADAGIASRRAGEKLILEGKVKVGAQTVTELGVKIDPVKDKIYCSGKLVCLPDQPTYLMLNKPKGYLTTVKDPQHRPTVMSLLPPGVKITPVGRLDKDSQGLLIFTNDGALAQQLTHPKFRHEKEYLVEVDKLLSDKLISLFKKGIKLEEGIAKADNIKRISNFEFLISIHQGWKRQIRRMVEAGGYKVKSLKRVRLGKLCLGNLPDGKYKYLNKEEII